MVLKSTLRSLARAPGFTVFVTLVIALGLAACVLVGSFAYAFFRRPLPVPAIDRTALALVLREGFDPYTTSYEDYATYAAHSRLSASVGVARNLSLNLGREAPERVAAAAIANYFETLQIAPHAGRLFESGESIPAAAVMLISHQLWQRRYGGAPDVIGRDEEVDGVRRTIVGVLPPGVDVPSGTDAWIPMEPPTDAAARLQRGCITVLRMRDGVDLPQLTLELSSLNRDLERQHPDHYRNFSVRAIPLRDQLLGDLFGRTRRTLFFLAAGLGLLLLLASANVGSLLLARSIARGRETAVRQALGASSRDILVPVLAESLLLSWAGAVVGVTLAWLLLPAARAINPVSAYALADSFRDIGLEPIVVISAIGLASLLGLACAGGPAVLALRSPVLNDQLRAGTRSGASPGALRCLRALLVGEIAIAAALLVVAGLLRGSFQQISALPLGFETANRYTTEIALPASRYATPQARENFAEQLVAAVGALPGVRAAGATINLPLSPVVGYDSNFEVEGRAPEVAGNLPVTAHRVVTPGYAATIGLRVLRGRFLSDEDRGNQRPVVVISERFAREAWGDADPLGKRVRRAVTGAPWLEVVGVVADVREDRANYRIDRPVWYLCYYQFPSALPLALVVETDRPNPAGLEAALRQTVGNIDPQQPISSLRPLGFVLDGLTSAERFGAALMAALSVLGSTLASLGLFGTISYAVVQRRREFGIRIALGATPRRILTEVLGQGLGLSLLGIALGLLGGAAAMQAFSSLLFATRLFELPVYLNATLLLAGVAVLASLGPALVATRVDPQVALRAE